MAEEETEGSVEQEEPKGKSKLPFVVIALVLVIAIGAMVFVFMMRKQGPQLEVSKPAAEYLVKEKMYQLKDGSYLRLGFSIVVDADKVEKVKGIIEKESPGRLPDGVNMLLGNKSREDLINGAHKREAFTRELKKMLEDHVFGNYNKSQESSKDTIEVRDVLISDYVTQSG